MDYYPICLDLKGRAALVVGGGSVAESKTEQLLKAGARVRVVSPGLTARLAEWAEGGAITHRRGEFAEADLEAVMLVISATDSQPVNEAVAAAAARRGLLCNVVDQPHLCSFITPALVERGRLQVSISTSGASPALAQRVKRDVAALIDDAYSELLEMAAALRATARQQIADYAGRRDLLQTFVNSEALALLRDGRRDEAEGIARDLLAQFLARREDQAPTNPSGISEEATKLYNQPPPATERS